MKGLYRLTRGMRRDIGSPRPPPGGAPQSWPDPTQAIHPSVFVRMQGDAAYRPPNLCAYLRRIGHPLATLCS